MQIHTDKKSSQNGNRILWPARLRVRLPFGRWRQVLHYGNSSNGTFFLIAGKKGDDFIFPVLQTVGTLQSIFHLPCF